MIDRDHVKHIADLAKLALSEEEIETFTGQLGAILEYVEQLDKADTGSVEATSLVAPGHDSLREDEEKPSLPREELLKNGACVKKGYFAIPKVIGQ